MEAGVPGDVKFRCLTLSPCGGEGGTHREAMGG